ncbi:MAG TPA: hypothetical protein VNA17_02765 [Pyrinomonadaceae bacterium]|nr:hypothetical protein [Pyrinomonadaceae bacterium]
MNTRKLDNRTIDALGQKLFESSHLADAEIDAIVSNDQLFDSVWKRIASEAAEPKASLPALLPLSLKVAAFPAFLIIAIATAGLLTSEEAVQVVSKDQIPEGPPESARPVSDPPQGKVEELSAGRAIKAEFRSPKPQPRRAAKKPQNKPVPVPDDEFYAVSYTGEDTAGGRIMRVELNRSALFALGVNLPLENDAATVKTDLLIGSDGVTRGLRIVK